MSLRENAYRASGRPRSEMKPREGLFGEEKVVGRGIKRKW